MTFDYSRLVELCLDIESYLGYLKGNELVVEYVEAQNVQGELYLIDHADEQIAGDYAILSYKSTPSDGQFACEFFGLRWVLPFDPQGDMPSWGPGYLDTLKEGARTSWESGATWASGIADYLKNLCGTFTEADVEKFQSVSIDLKNAIGLGLVPADFAASSNSDFGSTLVHWQGGWRDAFVTFYEHLPPRADLYASLVSITGDWVEGVGALVAAAQAGLLDFLQSVKDALAVQLGQWIEVGRTPESYDAPPDLGWVADIAGVAGDIVEVIPIVDKFAEIPGDVVQVAETIGDLKSAGDIIGKYVNTSGDDLPRRPIEFTMKTAEEIYNGLTSTMYDEFLGEFDKALQTLKTERAQSIVDSVNNVQGDRDWYPRSVPGIRNDSWESDDDN
ncbi:hypothetical protein DDE18_01140 [Nocardioides gansuensis]|uniref:Uncharacterized protein n=1 Tax=Nocardioides gansuensis TaxID=2138300 RepID=A0A2T8FEX1_9ACTN|nr:hypothetical protein [Nocardioides gansuensis]PVG84268.1 hypothetical protein DDE18_01140 [Nocardioides gansuensis]